MKRKKGFTIVELVIVISVVAILAAVLIPVFSSIISKANLSSDIQLVKNLNTSLNIDFDKDFNLKTNHTMYDALETAKVNGISVDKVKNNKARNHRIVWNSQSDRFVLINEADGSCVYFEPNTNQETVISDENKHLYFAIYDEMPSVQTYSIYASDLFSVENGKISDLKVGFDAGSNISFSSLTYDRTTASSAHSVIFRTNQGTQCDYKGYVGETESDVIYHYGEAGLQEVVSGPHSFFERGAATETNIKSGHYVIESDSIVGIVNASAEEGDVVIDLKSGSIQGTVKNTNTTNSVTINGEQGVRTTNFEGNADGGDLIVNFSSKPTYTNKTDMQQEADEEKPEIKLSGLGTEEKIIPSYDEVGEEHAECISIAGYSIKVFTNCNAYSYSEAKIVENTVKENTYTVKFDGNGEAEKFNSSSDHTHTFGEPSWEWNGYTSASATFICTADDCSFTEKVIVPTDRGYIDSKETKSATCTATGEKTYTAHLEHHNEQFENISPNKEIIDIDFNAHDIVHHDAKAATCTDIGWKSYVTCSRCNYTTYAEIQILGHNYLGEVTPSTCIEQGYTTHICTRCGDSYIDTYVDALGHSFGEWQKVTDSTCLGEGSESRTCINCGLVETRSTSVLGHTPSAKVFETTIGPTCTDEGSHDEVIYCSVCNSELERIHVVDNALGHDLVHHDAKEPTCIDIGWESYETCSRCDYTTYVELPALEHDYLFECFIWSEDYHTAQARYICSKDANHVTNYDATVTSTIKVPATCETMGTTTYTATYDNHEESQDVVDINPINHNFGEVKYFWNHGNSQLSATRICLNNANHIETETVNSTSEITLQPTCTTTGIRTFTSNSFENPAFSVKHTTEVIQAEGHNPGSIVVENQVDSTCIGVGHYDNVTYCTRCNTELSRQSITTDALGHEYNVVVVDPTCTEKGHTTHICTRCGDSYVDTYVDALDHDFVNGICTRCGESNKSNISIKFVNTDKYLYRVGNENSVATSSLFEGDISNIVITNIQGNAGGSYTNGNINFTGTGVVKVTANGSVDLLLEVVAGKNVEQYSELQTSGYNVLLNDIEMPEGCYTSFNNGGIYGNGFTFDVRNALHKREEKANVANNYVISLTNSIVDNTKIVGKVYTDFGATETTSDWNFPCVLVNGGDCVISNSYISNCASPVRVRNSANLLLKNTILKGGSFCNLDIRSGAAVTADGLTTINQVEGNDAADNGTVIVGLGIVFWYDGVGGNEKLTIKGDGLTQYNFVANNQKSHTVSTAQTVFNNVFSINSSNIKTIDNVKWVNTGILLLSTQIKHNNVTTPNGYSWQNVSLLGQNGYLCTQLASSFPSLPATPTDYSAEAQYPIAPTYSIEYPTATGKKNYLAKTDDSKEYCYYDSTSKKILISVLSGKEFAFNPNILNVSKNGCSLEYQAYLDEKLVGDTITFNSEGDYQLKFVFSDPYNYDMAGDQSYSKDYTTKVIDISVIVVIEDIKPAEFNFNGKGSKQVKGNNGNTYVMPNVTSTATDSIGSKSVGGQTVYYTMIKAKNSSGKDLSGAGTAYCPVFNGVVTITDYDLNNNPIVYNGSTTTMADGKLDMISNKESVLKWASANAVPTDNPQVSSKVLYFVSATISGVDRSKTTYVFEYVYTDTAGNVYHYFVGYIFPECKKCVTGDTLVTMADGTQKMIKDINAGDMVMSWSFENGCYEAVPVAVYWDHGVIDAYVIKLNFSDGSTVKVINNHGFYDLDLNTYSYITPENVEEFVGHKFAKCNGASVESVTLDSFSVTREDIETYSLQSAFNYNFITEGILSITGEDREGHFEFFEIGDDMKYIEELKQAEIEKYGLYTYDDWSDYLTEEEFYAVKGQYFKILIGRGIYTVEDVITLINENLRK